ncbi:L-allo-threonine aldolase [Tribonema minus]|uniref:L-allo-threonine aldolase n=1 Tax=Tribonema minus TaxID=303371 RepID=A0A835ZE62_9STRA|nr:L-allo-threonine aldolase [Tribonema minus]
MARTCIRKSFTSAAAQRPVSDFRSDTVTKPCKNMRNAMYQAQLGDDVYGEDPSVNTLEEYAAYITGKEAALFVPSGTMGNLVAVGAHCARGDEIVLGATSHMFLYEGGGASAFMGASYACVRERGDGTLALNDVAAALRDDDVHCPRSRLLCLENTHNRAGGAPLPRAYLDDAARFAADRGLKLHIDGARLANAAVAQRTSMRHLLEGADSASICLSKGLGAPVGSVLVGSPGFVAKARRLRKALGGGMRQAGVLAAAGLEALINNFLRLSDDHANAAALARGLAAIRGVRQQQEQRRTNMVYFALESGGGGSSGAAAAAAFARRLADEHGVLVGGGYGADGGTMRAVTHLDVGPADVERALAAVRVLLAVAPAPR